MKPPLLNASAWASCIAALLYVAAPTARADYASTVLGYNPVVYYRLNDQVAGITPTDTATNHGSLGAVANGYYFGTPGTTYTHPVTGGLVGAMDGAANFQGGGLGIPFLNEFNQNTFAAETWVNPTPSGGVIMADVSMDGRYGWIVYYGEDGSDVVSLRLYYGNGGSTFDTIISGTVPDSQWHHVVAQSDGTNFSLYVDGASIGSYSAAPYIGPSIAHGCPFMVASRPDDGYQLACTEGWVAYYSNALSAAQITNHYNTGIATSPTPSYSTVVLADGALGYWPLDDGTFTAPDPSTYPAAANISTLGTSANGTYLPGTHRGAAGPGYAGITAGGACHFDGLGSGDADRTGTSRPAYVDLTAASGSLAFSTAMTVMAWVQRDAYLDSFSMIVGDGDTSWRLQRGASGGSGNDFQWGLNNNASGGAFFGIAGTTINVNDNGWHHVAGVFDGTNVSFYLDGVLDSSLAAPGETIAAPTVSAAIGENVASTGRVWDGSIAEVALFSTGLTASQVLAVYNSAEAPATIVGQPQITPPVYVGFTVPLSVQAVGALPLSYQWTSNSVPIHGQTGTTLTLSDVSIAFNASYAVIVTNAYGAVTSSAVALNVVEAQPVVSLNQGGIYYRKVGESIKFSGQATGGGLNYEWYLGTTLLESGPNATNLALKNLQLTNAGTYLFVAANAVGAATNTVVLNVDAAPIDPNYGLVAYWKFDETNGLVANDSSGRGNGLALSGYTNDNSQWVSGEIGGALSFNLPDGIQDMTGAALAQETNGMILDNQDEFTFSFWMKEVDPTPSSGANPRIINPGFTEEHWVLFGGNGSGWGIGLYPYADVNGSPALDANGDPTADVTQGVWEQWVIVYNRAAATFEVYRNGTNFVANGFAVRSAPGTVQWIVGHPEYAVGAAPGDAWFGYLDDFRVYNRLLTPSEAAAAYGGPPVISGQNGGTYYRKLGDSITLNGAAGVGLTYEWHLGSTLLKSGVNADNADTTLVLTNLQLTNAGTYTLVVSNAMGAATITVVLHVDAAPIDLNYGLLAYWKFDETNGLVANDSSGRSNRLVLSGYTSDNSQWVPGKVGGALSFNLPDGSQDLTGGELAQETNGMILDNQDEFTFSFWMKEVYPTPSSGANSGIIVPGFSEEHWVLFEGNGSHAGIGFYPYADINGKPTVDVNGDPTGDPTLGVWEQWVMVYNRAASTYEVYRNGTNFVANGVAYRTSPRLAQWVVGHRENPYQDPGNAWFGYLDDFRVYNRLLSPSEAVALVEVGGVGAVTLSITRSGPNLLVSWTGAGTLQSAPSLTGPWADIPGATTSPYSVTPGAVAQFFRVRQ